MPWFKVDDGFYDHPKVDDLSLAAVGLWTKAGSYCARYLTNGAIPKTKLRTFGANEKLADELVAAGLWLTTATGFQFSGWPEYQDSKNDVEDRRAIDAQRKKLARESTKKLAILQRDEYACVYCGTAVTAASVHIDHVMPISRGGSNHINNLVSSCASCNTSKGDQTPEEWAESGKISLRLRGLLLDNFKHVRDPSADVSLDEVRTKTKDSRIGEERVGEGVSGSSSLSEPKASTVPANDVDVPAGSGHQQTVLDAFREAWPQGVTMPRLYGEKLRQGVEHCRSVAKVHGKDLYATAMAVCLAAAPGSPNWDFQIAKVDPYAAAPPHATTGLFAAAGTKPGRLQPTRPSPPEAFANAPSVEEQLEQARQKKARQSNGTQ